MKLDSHKVRKVTKPDFLKKIQAGQEGPESPENNLKMRFLGVGQKSNPFLCTFLYWHMKVPMFLEFVEDRISWKNLVLQLVQKPVD